MTEVPEVRKLEHADIVAMPIWEDLGGEVIEPNGAAVDCTIPDSPRPAEIYHIAARGGDVFYEIGGDASEGSPGWIAEGGRIIEGPMADLIDEGLSVYAEAGVYAHIKYYRENV